MSLAQAISSYVSLNLLVAVGFLGLGLFSLFLRIVKIRIPAIAELRLHYRILTIILLLACIHPLIPRSPIFSPAAKVWSARSIKNFNHEYGNDSSGYLSLPTPMGTSHLQANHVAFTWTLLAVLLLSAGGFLISRDLLRLRKIKNTAYLVRRIGQVHIYVSESIRIPFSFWWPGQSCLVVPSILVQKRRDYRMSVAHEIQHHRHGDTKWVYVMWALRLVCIVNPFIHFWNRKISEFQEFACDEALVDQNKVESQAYARCLIEVAQLSLNRKSIPVCATGLGFLGERNILKRRIEKMFSNSGTKMGRSIGASVVVLLTLIMGVTAFASKAWVQDRRVSMMDANAMAARTRSSSEFPIVVNDLVLKQLNRYIGTPEGREFIRNALAQMENYKSLVGAYLQKYDVPEEIMALPIVESGYMNLSEQEAGTPGRAAGIWQFIPSTAHAYNLRVPPAKDDRVNVELETDAAMRYLKSNQLRFKDWQLSVLAYNMGEDAVQKGIDATGSRDAWTLIRNGYEGDKDYLAKAVAAMIIKENPKSIE